MPDLLCCIPVEDSYDGPERNEFPETPALCIYYREPYEGTPNREKNSDDYITQIAVPIKG